MICSFYPKSLCASSTLSIPSNENHENIQFNDDNICKSTYCCFKCSKLYKCLPKSPIAIKLQHNNSYKVGRQQSLLTFVYTFLWIFVCLSTTVQSTQTNPWSYLYNNRYIISDNHVSGRPRPQTSLSPGAFSFTVLPNSSAKNSSLYPVWPRKPVNSGPNRPFQPTVDPFSSILFPFESNQPSSQLPSKVNGYISVASSMLPETLYQKTLKRQSSSASSLNGVYTLDERNSSSLLQSPTSSVLSSLPSSSPPPSISPSTIAISTSSASLSSSLPPSPSLPSAYFSSPTPSPLSATTLGYHLDEKRYTSIDIRDLLRKELDERVREHQKAKQHQLASHTSSPKHYPSTPLPSSTVNLFALLPPKKGDLDRLASHNSKHHSQASRVDGITNGHSRNPPGVNILVFKPNSPFKETTDPMSPPSASSPSPVSPPTKSSSSPGWGESFGLSPRIPVKPSIYNDPFDKDSSSPSDAKQKPNINQISGPGSHPVLTKHSSASQPGHRPNREGEGDFGINYITRLHSDDSNSGSFGTRVKTVTTNGTHSVGSKDSDVPKTTNGLDYVSGSNNNINHDNRDNRDPNNHDRYDYDYEVNGASSEVNGTTITENGPDDAYINNEAYRLTTERLAYILIGSCCALSILCLIIVAFSIRCRDMCDEYKAWKKAEKLAMLNYRYQTSHARSRLRSGTGLATPGPGIIGANTGQGIRGGGPEANFFAHRGALGEQDSNLSYPPIKTTRPIFGPSCCCCPNPGSAGSAWHSRGTETCPRGYFHPCPRGKLPFGAASSIQAFPRSHVQPATATNNFPSDEDDSLNASIVVDGIGGHIDPQTDGGGHHNAMNQQCTCVDPPGQPSTSTNHHHLDNEISTGLSQHSRHVHHHQQQQQSQHHGHPSSSTQHHPQSQQHISSFHMPHSHLHHHPSSHQQQQQHQRKHLNNSQTNGDNDKSFNPSWLQSSIIVDELHRKHSQLVRDQKSHQKTRNSEDQRFIFWSENQDRLI